MKLIASDFDGTIYRNQKISVRDKEAVLRWQKEGNVFGIVTGRGSDILRTLAEHGINLDYAIAYNGALVFNSKGEVLCEDWFKRGIAREYYDFAYDTDFKFAREKNTSDFPEDETKEHQLSLLLEDEDDAKELAVLLNEKFEGRLTSYSNGHWINTVKYGVSKATGIARYAEIMNISEDDIYTVGDFFNDLPMLQAFNGYVVSSCHPEMKKFIPNVCEDIAHLTEIINDK